MKKHLIVLILIASSTSFSGFSQDPIVQPQGNYGLTSVLDGAPPGPGFYIMEYLSYYSGTLQDANGDNVIGPNGDIKVNSFALLNQGIWLSNKKILGGQFLINAIVPLVHLNVPNYDSAPTDFLGKNSVLGDIFIGPGIQWSNKKLFGKIPYFHRIELDFILPTGGYDETAPINVGSGHFSFQPYYAQTLFFSKNTSLSLRHHYTINSKVDKSLGGSPLLEVKAGNYYHANYSLETLVGKSRFSPGQSGETRIAVQGYFGSQGGADEINGVEIPDTEENVFAIGPALHMITKKGLALTFKAAFETGAENRTKGTRATFRLVKYFPPKRPQPTPDPQN